MIRSAVTVSLVPEARGGPFVFWDDLAAACRKAQQLGFDAVEIFAESGEALRKLPIRQLLADHGLALAAVGTGAGWVKHRLHLVLPDAGQRRQACDFIRSLIDEGGAFGAPAIIGSMQGRWGDGVDLATAEGWLVESLTALGEHARQYQVPLLFEPLNRYETNLCHTIERGVKLIQMGGSTNVKLLADLFHMNIEEANTPASLRAGGQHIGHVHFVDSNRRPAGLGHIDFPPVFRALREIGFRGFASAEAFPYPDSNTAARQTIGQFQALTRKNPG